MMLTINMQENILLEPMYDAPGSSIRYVVVDKAAANRQRPPLYFSRGEETAVEQAVAADDEALSTSTTNTSAKGGDNQGDGTGKAAGWRRNQTTSAVGAKSVAG
jgi:hypothetical protein